MASVYRMFNFVVMKHYERFDMNEFMENILLYNISGIFISLLPDFYKKRKHDF